MDAAASCQDNSPALWQRLAGLRFRLCDHVSVDPLCFRGSRWYLLRNGFNRQQLRLNERLYALVEGLDGRRTVAQLMERLARVDANGAAQQQEVISALSQLQAADMLVSDAPPDIAVLLGRQRQLARRRRLARWLRLLSPRVPLLAPDAFLSKKLPLVRWMLHPLALLMWLGIAAAAGLQALMQWDALTLYGAQRLNDPRQWLLIVALYPLVKGLHELGHGFAAKAFGAEVNEMGVTFLVFVPVPYVDATAASALENKYQRIWIGAAGILVELLLASLALFAWLALDDGLARDAAFATMLIGGVSTLLFNGNPLLRFDGYYVLADAIEIPNLATRSSRFYGYLARRYLMGLGEEPSPVTAAGESGWFLFYGAASTLYRVAIGIGIALFLIASIPVLGVLMAAWLLIAQLVLPLWRMLRYLLTAPALTGRRTRSLGLVGGLIAGACLLLALVPVSSSTRVDGIVLLPEQAAVRAGVDGFLQRQWVSDGTEVVRGALLFELRNRRLYSERAVLEGRVREHDARRDQLGFDDRVAREIETERLAEAREELTELRERENRLVVRSPGDGVIRVTAGRDPVGRYVRKGDMLAYLAQPNRAIVRVVANQEDGGGIRGDIDRIEVRLADRGSPVLQGRLLSEVPLATKTLPSAALGIPAGGLIPVDARDPAGTATLEPVFAFDVEIPAPAGFVGGRAHVRFEHPAAPLLTRWYDIARRQLMRRIGE